MPLRKIRKEVSDLIADNHIQRTFILLREKLNPESQNYKDLTLAQGTFSHNCHGWQNNFITWQEYTMGCSRASQNVISICEQLTEHDLLFPKGFKADAGATTHESDLVRNSRKAHKHIMNAKKLRADKKYLECITELRNAIVLKPHSIANKTDLATVLRLTHQYEEAIEILEKILKDFPRDAHSRNELALCYRECYQLDLAIAILQDGLKLVETNNHFHTNLFYIHLFFHCKVEYALLVKTQYRKLTGQELIRDVDKRQLYDVFICHLDNIQRVDAQDDIIVEFLNECIYNKRAYHTAQKLLCKLIKKHPNSSEFMDMRQKLPPQYRHCLD